MKNYIPLDKKVVVITGASSGAGRAAALEFARHKTKLVLTARREEPLNEVVRECKAFGSDAIAVTADVTNAKAMEDVAKAAVLFGGKIDVWINNAGVLAAGGFTETPVEVHDRVIEINLMGYLHGAYAALPHFKRQEHGILINNISVGGWFPTPFAVGYSASKFGLRGFSKSLRGELSEYKNIYVCDLFPAFLDTPGIQHAANYTKAFLKPAPPVYDPQRLAKLFVYVANNPRNSVTMGSASTLLRLLHFLFPALAVNITSKVMRMYFRNAKPIPETSGNLFHSVDYGTSIHGGWTSPKEKMSATARGALFVSSMLAGFLIAKTFQSK